MSRGMWVTLVVYAAFTAFITTIFFIGDNSSDLLAPIIFLFPIVAFFPFCWIFVAQAFSVSHKKLKEAEREETETKPRAEPHRLG